MSCDRVNFACLIFCKCESIKHKESFVFKQLLKSDMRWSNLRTLRPFRMLPIEADDWAVISMHRLESISLHVWRRQLVPIIVIMEMLWRLKLPGFDPATSKYHDSLSPAQYDQMCSSVLKMSSQNALVQTPSQWAHWLAHPEVQVEPPGHSPGSLTWWCTVSSAWTEEIANGLCLQNGKFPDSWICI